MEPTGTNPSPGTGGSIPETFWNPLRQALTEQGWRVNHYPAYPVVAVKGKWIIGMIDAHAIDPKAAFTGLNKWAEVQHVAPSRLLLAVYLQTTEHDWRTVTAYKDGNRMEPQAMTAVYQLVGGQFYPPKTPDHSFNLHTE